MAGSGWWCCCSECIIFQDEFTRSGTGTYTSELGPDYTEQDDTIAEIVDHRLKITKGAVLVNTVLDDKQGAFYLDIYFAEIKLGNWIEFWFYHESPSVPALKASFAASPAVGSGTDFWIASLWDLKQGWYPDNVELIPDCNTNQMPVAEDSTKRVTISYDRTTFRINEGPTPTGYHYELWRCYDPPKEASTQVMIVNAGTNPIYLDTLWWSDHEVHDPLCPWAGCFCEALE